MAVPFRLAIQARMNNSGLALEAISVMTREQWDELIPCDVTSSPLMEAAQKFSCVWTEFIDSVMNDCGIVMTVSGGTIASAALFFLLLRNINIPTDS
jgi:imidazole glycerol phosphate synthase subunit HisF